jgi:hypothetical protein
MVLKLKKRARMEAAAAPVKGQRIRSTRGSKFVLFIGDEGAILVYIKGNVVQSRQFVPDASQQHLNDLRQTLLSDPLAPILMVVDSMDQSYVQQTLPPVSALSVNKLIKRRLERDFGVNDIKGAILLGREKNGRKDWNFLMISLERSPQLTVWLDFIEEMPHRFRGIRLVSVETEVLIRNIERAMGVPKEGTGAKWKFFVSHNKVGGFRQVILHNGRLIFTRLAQPIGESNTEVIAGNIEQEMLSTIEYMRRLNFDPQDGLDIYILASSGIKDSIDRNKFNFTSLHVLAPYEVAQYLNIEGATQPSDQFGDVILASSIGCSRKHVLTLSTPLSRKIDTYYQLVYYQRLAAILAGFVLIAYAATTGYDIYNLSEYEEDLTRKKSVSQQNLNQLQDEIGKTDINIEKAHELIQLYREMASQSTSPLPLIGKFRLIVQAPTRIKSIVWKIADTNAATAAASPTRRTRTPRRAAAASSEAPSPMQVTLTLEFPEAANDPKIFRALSKKVLSDFRNAFPEPYSVAYAALPERFIEKEKMEIDFAGTEQEVPQDTGTSARPEVQLIIKGEMVTEALPASPALIPSQ